MRPKGELLRIHKEVVRLVGKLLPKYGFVHLSVLLHKRSSALKLGGHTSTPPYTCGIFKASELRQERADTCIATHSCLGRIDRKKLGITRPRSLPHLSIDEVPCKQHFN